MSNKLISKYQVYFVFLVAVALYSASPFWRKIPTTDSGVYLCSACSLLNGNVPYLKTWDHKPPLIYLIDALGIILGGKESGTTWGLWFLEFLNLFFCVNICFEINRNIFGKISAFFASFLMILNVLLFLHGGNEPEEFCMIFQWMSILLYFSKLSEGWKGIGVGVLGGLSILLKPTTIAIFCTILIISLPTLNLHNKIKFKFIGTCLLGVLLPLAITLIWLNGNNALDDFTDQVITYNRTYSSFATNWDRFQQLLSSIFELSLTGLWPIAFMGWVTSVSMAFKEKSPFFLFLVLVWPLEFLFVILPGRLAPHYLLTTLPINSILTAAGISRLESSHLIKIVVQKSNKVMTIGALIIIICGIGVLKSGRLEPLIQQFQQRDHLKSTLNNSLVAVEKETSPGESGLIWGAESGLYFAASLTCPTRYIYQLPLFTRNYSNDTRIDEFLRNIKSKPPKIIIDTSSSNPNVPPIEKSQLLQWQDNPMRMSSVVGRTYFSPEEIQKFRSFVNANYYKVSIIDPDQWILFKLKLNN